MKKRTNQSNQWAVKSLAVLLGTVLALSGGLGQGAWMTTAWALPDGEETRAREEGTQQTDGSESQGESARKAEGSESQGEGAKKTDGSESQDGTAQKAAGENTTEEGTAGEAGTGAVAGQQQQITEEVTIGTAQELMEFSRACVSESYSRGKRFVLSADINLQGVEFQPVPVFAGIFDGGGHSVIGLSVQSAGSGLGVFRYVQEGAVVKNLQVHGTIAPEGSKVNIGGIAGTNRGTIENCSFRGEIRAHEALGGIAGFNEATGVIRGCENHGAMTGNLKTGGIAGNNEGIVEDCVNRGEINTTGQQVDGDSGSQFSLGSLDLEEGIKVERINDAGGIAGFSLGKVRNCVNYGAVGYPHTGYNMGGIAGRHSGLIEQCENHGTVQGRKDAGGIVGQFEPYISVSYEEDMFGSLESQVEELSNMGDSLSGMIEQAGDTASGNLDQIDARIQRIRDIGSFYRNLYREGGDSFDRDMDRTIDDMQDILDHMDLNLTDYQTEARYRSAQEKVRLIKELRAQMDKGFEGDPSDVAALQAWLQQRRQQMEQLARYTAELKEDLEYVAAHAPGEMVGGVESFGDDMGELQTEANTLTDLVRLNADKARDDLHSLDEEMTAQANNLSGDIDALTDNLRDSRLQIRNQKNQITSQIDQIRTTISDGVDRAKEDKELFEDVSDLEADGLEEGMVSSCVNRGTVTADYQAGGIVGIIGMETGLDPEQDLEAEEERTLNVTRNIRAIVLDCRNEEEITVVNDYAGGIAGKANLGALIQNQNYGDVTAEEGGYAGGITGSSAYVLRKNYNMCTVDGHDYTGGIAGWGTDILDNYSMVSFWNPEGEWMGAIAGNADAEGIIEGNVYVDEGIGAVDGVTYEEQAQGLFYEEFRNLEGMPKEFGRLSVSFMVEDQVLKTIYCDYGTGVRPEDIPRVPQKDGYYYMWEEKELSCVKSNEKVHAIYKTWNTTIASSDDKMPVLLAEANFYPGTTLVLESCEEAVPVPDGFTTGGTYQYSIIQPEGVAQPETITVHVLADQYRKNAVVGILENGQLQMTDSRRDGAYLVFEMNGTGAFAVLEPEKEMPLWLIAAGVAAAAALLWIAAARRKKRPGTEKKSETEKEAAKEIEDSETSEA